jgi:hypothetical protein
MSPLACRHSARSLPSCPVACRCPSRPPSSTQPVRVTPSLTPGAEIHAGRAKRRRVESADQPANVTKDPEPLSPRTRSRHPKVSPTCGSHGGSMNWTCTDRPLRGGGKRVARDQSARHQDQIGLDLGFLCAPGGIRTPTARSVVFPRSVTRHTRRKAAGQRLSRSSRSSTL